MHYTSIGVLGRRIRQRSVSPVEVVDACLDRIAAFNPALNAFITVLDDDARAQAREAEAEIRAGRWRGPLHGVPIGVKDFFDTAGVATTAGSVHFKDRVPDRDAESVRRLKQAGAIVIGKTNMDALGMATTGLTSDFGPVCNPWDREYVPGGSSAGSAAAVAAGLCYATLDTDAVGSVRLPAACCGVVGFKGSGGLISLQGILGDQPVDDFIRWMAHGAVTTRSVADTACVLDAIAAGDEAYAVAVATPRAPVRIGAGGNFTADTDITRAFAKAVAALAGAGYDVRETVVPFGDPGQGSLANIAADRRDIGAQAFADVDVILLPTLSATVPTVAQAAGDPERAVSAEGTAFANYYDLPAVSVPCGVDRHNLPIGLQIVGRPGGERLVLHVAHHYERVAGSGAIPPML